MAQFVRKVVENDSKRRATLDSQGQEWAANHPAIWEYLTLEQHDDGSVRQRSMLMVLVEDGVCKVCVQDRDQGKSLWVSSSSITGALAALESHLQGGTGDWRQMRDGGPNGKARKGGR